MRDSCDGLQLNRSGTSLKKEDSYQQVKFKTRVFVPCSNQPEYLKSDNNPRDDLIIYAHGEKWLHRHHIMGRAVGFVPYAGWFTIIMSEKPIVKDCAVGLLFALLPVLGGTSGALQGVISMSKSLMTLCTFLVILSISSRTCVPWFLKLMISLSSQTNELYQLAAVAFCLLVAWCSDKLGLSLELGSFAAGVMISTTDLAQHTLEQIEPIRNFFAALFLASIGMLIHVHFLWNHVDILLAAVILVIVVKTLVVTSVVKGFGYTNKTSLLVGMSLAQIGEFAFVLLSRASNLHLVEGKLYLLLLGTTALSLVTTPFLFKLIPAVVHLGVLLRWFSPDAHQTEIGYKGESVRADSGGKRISLMVQGPHAS